MDAQAAEPAIDEALRRRFEAAWLAGEPLAIDDCLPPRDAAAYLLTLEELVQIELEFAWKAWSARRQSDAQLTSAAPAASPQPIEHYLQRFAALAQPSALTRLIEQEFHVRERFGDRPKREEYRRRFGAILPLAGRFGEQEETWQAAPAEVTRLGKSSPAASSTDASPAARRFGNYDLLDEIGRGGMGVVYRARQLSAERIVALKVIRAESLTGLRPEQRTAAVERFHQEALAAARLDHEHIVAIYEVGEVAGEPFFSMRHVAGSSLAELLWSGPLEERRAAAYLEAVARAVAAAHEAGILHRDLKPQNILIERRSDRPMVADFGLAKLLEQPSELTRAGDVMGTPSYMPPEQASDSSRVTVQSDVYSLGATLYHALTGRPPFQAATAVETLRQVCDVEPVPPSRLNRAIGRDLETICLTCLHKEPARRYRSAAALADDLQRYREGFPILARPSGRLERAARWCRRNPLLAAALGLAAAFLTAAITATTVGYATTAAALSGKTRALSESERSYEHSREVVNQFFTRVSEEVLLDQPGTQPLRNDLLKLALAHYQRFLAERGAEAKLLEEIARTHYRVGVIQQALEPSAAAGQASLEEALRMQRELLRAAPNRESLIESLGDTLNALGQARQRSGGPGDGLAEFREARQFRQRLFDVHAERIDLRRKLANTIMNIGVIHKQLGDFPSAQEAQDQAQALRRAGVADRKLESATPDERLLWRDLALGHNNLASLAAARQRTDAAESELAAAIELLEPLAAAAANDLRVRERLAASYHMLARLRHEQLDYPKAAVRYDQALAAWTDLHRNNPRVVEFQERLALLQVDYGTLHLRRRNPAAAQKAFQAARDLLVPLVPAPGHPEHAERQRNYAVALRELARAQIGLKQPAAAIEPLLALSQQYLERLVEQAQDAASKQRLSGDLEQTKQVLGSLGEH